MRVYYNEIDPFAAAWLRELMKAGQIPDGEVDERSIELVSADDLRGFGQCHFFAGIGGWAYALRLAGWPDDREVWTGSCPCQPFSSAGAQAGGHDPRDLWPVWRQLIAECRPPVVFGEQVEAAIGHGWLDRVCTDLEKENYAVGACALSAAGVGAFHKRERLWFVADAGRQDGDALAGGDVDGRGEPDGVEDSQRQRCETPRHVGAHDSASASQGAADWDRDAGATCGVGESDCEREAAIRGVSGRSAIERGGSVWADAEWIPCRDGKARPVEPGTFPLAHGVSARVGRLRGYGNAIVPQVAQVFIEAYLDVVNS